MIVVLDTNIVASATYWHGKPAHCLEAWVLGRFELAISHPILTEYEVQAGGIPIVAASDFLRLLGTPENPA